MTTHEQHTHKETATSGLASSILNRIEQDKIAPTPRWQYLCHDYFIWFLWILSVVVGAIAVSVLLFVSINASYAFYEATHETAFEFFVEIVPFVWLLVLLTMAGLAYYNIRNTKTGYRYPFWQLLISSFVFSFIGGALLHAAGFGYVVDKMLTENMPAVRTLARVELEMWQAPDQGRLVGVARREQHGEANEIRFEAVNGAEWTVYTGELMPKDRDLLTSGQRVRLLGMTASDTAMYFYGCAVLPWMFDKPVPLADLRAERSNFMERIEHQVARMQEFGEEVVDEQVVSLLGDEKDTFPNNREVSMHCPKMPLVKRFVPVSN